MITHEEVREALAASRSWVDKTDVPMIRSWWQSPDAIARVLDEARQLDRALAQLRTRLVTEQTFARELRYRPAR